MGLDGLLDPYALRARLYPGLIAALPIPLAAWIVWPGSIDVLRTGLAAAGAIGAGYLVSQVVRDRGKVLEHALWDAWGGPPTTRRLRNRSSAGVQGHSRVRESVERAVKRPLPTATEETRDPEAADLRYKEAIAYLRVATRDRERFPVVFANNVAYGFRRNMRGMKGPALWIIGATIAAVAAWWIARPETVEPIRAGAALAVCSILGLTWMVLVRASWVKVAAEDYADHLLAAAPLVADSS